MLRPPDSGDAGTLLHRVALMGTVVTIQVVGHDADPGQRAERSAAVERAVDWFRTIEARCSRFDPESDVSRLARRVGVPVPVDDLLFEAIQFALAVAAESDGAFDPTIGAAMEARGFNREYQSGATVRSGLAAEGTSFRDVRVDHEKRTVTLLRPVLLDLGAVAKGLAVDTAARELAPFENFAIDAGGDLYLAGRNAKGEPWSVGIRHPRAEGELIETLHVSDAAVCTSGDYERRSTDGHHIFDPRTGHSADACASVTVVADSAMVADALGTAAFVLGPERGIELLRKQGVRGLIFTTALKRFET